jgi:hypothetical protein
MRSAPTFIMHLDKAMKDVKVDVRVNVTVDAASVVLLIATTTMAFLFYKQNKLDKQDKSALRQS